MYTLLILFNLISINTFSISEKNCYGNPFCLDGLKGRSDTVVDNNVLIFWFGLFFVALLVFLTILCCKLKSKDKGNNSQDIL